MPAVSPARSRWARLRELIGTDAAAVLVSKRGGHQVVIPTTVRAESLLVQIAGDAAMRRVVHELQGATVYVPRWFHAADRNSHIREAAVRGERVIEIAARFGLSVRQVRNILRS